MAVGLVTLGVTVPPIEMSDVIPPGAQVAGAGSESEQSAGERLAAKVAERLLAQEIPAQAAPTVSGGGYVLFGRVASHDTTDEMVRVTLFWDLRRSTGVRERTFEHQIYMDRVMWAAGTQAAMDRLSEPVVVALTAHFLGATDSVEAVDPMTIAPPEFALDGLAVRVASPMESGVAPADVPAMATLQMAVRETLARAGVRLVSRRDRAEVSVIPTVERVAEDANSDRVTMKFAVIRRDGEHVGQVSLSNIVPAAELETHWQGVVFLVAEAALPGLLEVLATSFDRLGEQDRTNSQIER